MLSTKKIKPLALSLVLIVTAGTFACTEKNEQRRVPAPAATGRGNGGNTKVSASMVTNSITNLKIPLRKCFEGLRALALAEQTLSRSTTINGDKELLELLLNMTKDSELDLEDGFVEESDEDEAPSVFDDIDTKDNLILDPKGCFDYRNQENAAGTELLGIGKPICFSMPMLKDQTIEGGETAFQIALLGLAAHEFVHHFYDGGTHEKSEALANKLQDFLVKDLSRSSVISSEAIISIDEFDFVDQFLSEAKKLQEQVRNVPPANNSVEEIGEAAAEAEAL